MTTLGRSTKRRSTAVCAIGRRALLIWPGLDVRSLSRCGCRADRIALFVAQQTNLSVDVIIGILVPIERAEPPFYFG